MGRRTLIAASATGLLLAAAFPPFRTGFLALGSLVPLLYALESGGIRKAFAAGYTAGLVVAVCTLYWVTLPTVAGGTALILFLPVLTGVVSAAYRFLRIHWGPLAVWLFPFLWTASEWLLASGQLAFPWNMLAHTQSYYLPFIQFASVTGAAGVSLWVAFCNVLVFELVKDIRAGYAVRATARVLLLGVMVVAPVVYGVSVMPGTLPDAGGTVALLQGNIDPYAKWDPAFINRSFDTYMDMSRAAAVSRPDLIVWPETAAPTYLAGRRGKSFRGRLHALSDSLGIPVLTGAPHYAYDRDQKRMRYYNSAFLFTPGKLDLVSYDKIKLVPFSEKIPFEEEIPLLQKINLGEADFSYGSRKTVFEAGPFSFGTVICFESAFGGLVRSLVRAGAGFIVNITNDGWFGRTSGPYQHLRIAVFRAIENRVGIVRCANSGISAFIDPYGRITKPTGLFERTAVTGKFITRPPYVTPFTRYGDIVSPLCAGITLCAMVAGAVAAFRERSAA